MNSYGIPKTKLIIKQGSTINIAGLKNDILNEVKNNDTLLYERDAQITAMKTAAAKNLFDNKEILKEATAIFPDIYSTSLSNHIFYTNKDSSYSETVFVYQTKKELKKVDKLRLESWIKQRLSLNDVVIFKQP